MSVIFFCFFYLSDSFWKCLVLFLSCLKWDFSCHSICHHFTMKGTSSQMCSRIQTNIHLAGFCLGHSPLSDKFHKHHLFFFYLLNCLYLFWSIPRGTLLLFLPRTVSKRLKAKDGVQPESLVVLRWGKTQVGHRHVWGSLLKTTSIERFYLSTMQQTPAVKVITAHH